MGHRAAVYTVRVKRAHKRKDKFRSLGDIDNAATHLGTRTFVRMAYRLVARRAIGPTRITSRHART